jgi:uncharacterized protein YeeX (DUF496 family)
LLHDLDAVWFGSRVHPPNDLTPSAGGAPIAMLNSNSKRASLEVAPLALGKSFSGGAPYQNYQPHDANVALRSEMTPPATPNGSQEDLVDEPEGPPIFHNFLRAFYPFHPTYAMSDSSITLPLDEGDVVLVHSIHTNGWADGTLLTSGARGWLPTNYCESYEPEDMRNLLKALLDFWDLLRSSSVDDRETFGNQEFMKGIIAGVRYLLERTNCLTRESSTVQRSERIRKCRKSLMSELSALVKTAKRIQEGQRVDMGTAEDVNDVVDEMILKAFRIVFKGVRFLDALEEDRRARAPASVTVMDTVAEESIIPSTPPAETLSLNHNQHPAGSFELASPGLVEDGSLSVASSEQVDFATNFSLPNPKRLSSLSTQGASGQSDVGNAGRAKRQSWSISHRVSLAGPATCSRSSHLVSERLSKSHDAFLSHLGSFIGRLQYQSQSRPQLASAIKQCAMTGGELLAVIDNVCAQSYSSSALLAHLRGALFQRIEDLVFAARDTLINVNSEDDLIMPQDTNTLLASATGCVRVAGECIAKARVAIERVGDFEYDLDQVDLGIDLDMLDVASQSERSVSEADRSDVVSTAESTHTSGSATPGPMKMAPMFDKPLPEVPKMDIATDTLSYPAASEASSSRPGSQSGDAPESMVSSISSIRPAITLPKLSTMLSPEHPSPVDGSYHYHDDSVSSRFDSLAASSAGSSATYLSRDSETSVLSQSSTRATTPEHAHAYMQAPRNQPSMSELSAATTSSHTEEVDDVEMRLMEKTFAHELIFNREGQVTGGSLPALVERLTTHEAAPDAMFVSTFYLTFRLFCTPNKLAEALIERFEYVGESPHLSGPVRLRVYNAFKGWLETHWKHELDNEALQLIIPFAEQRLATVLPQAARRLLELAHKVSSAGGSLVPRLVSSMGKTSTATAHYVPPDTPVPQPSISKSQQNILATFKNGGNLPSILDFEPVEIARQLTIKQMNIFCSIQPDELISSQWMKNSGVDAPNVKAMSSLSTDLSNLVAYSIIQHQEIKKRAAVIKQWIKIAHQCLELHNYDGLMAIICSLNSAPIGRLRRTWDLISVKRKEMLATLQRLIEPSQNNKVLRTRLHDHVPPCLPFLGMYLTDLTFVDIGNPATKQMSMGNENQDQRSSGLTVVNFDKHTRTAKIIGELQRFQIPYRLTAVPELQDWLSAQISKVREGDQGKIQVTYYRQSLLLEPRESAAARAAVEPAPSSTPAPSRGDLFGWMSRDRTAQNTTPAPV